MKYIITERRRIYALHMDKTLLITRPKHDSTVRYLFYWAKDALELAKKKGMKVWDLDGQRANRKEVESILKKRKPSLVFFEWSWK